MCGSWLRSPLLLALAVLASSASQAPLASAGTVDIHDNQLFVDGVAQPQLYGAELQYFRLRGGTERNIPREKVIALWNAALDRMVEAHMNAISFYIPWDFHEYAEGKFDFTGTADEDGDGKPDYPSRDLVTFFRLVQEHGIKHILVRPGPYINAEWGFLGFGAIPEWFHKKFPESHMKNADGLSTKLYDYDNADFREYSKRWLTELHRQVLSKFIGPGKPIDFIQLDNETNYMWQSLYNHDYSPAQKSLYRSFLQTRYGSLDGLNQAYSATGSPLSVKSFDEIQPPTQAGQNVAADQDWYRYHDSVIHEYLHYVRTIWENLGVREPQVLFTLAESYNATQDGLLPNYKFRNDPGYTGMMTVNMYPKTYENDLHPLHNNPFKADHDVKAASEANANYLGKKQDWAMGPEIQAGWWKGTPVTIDSRRQTYLSTIGHGLKALFLYYFNEGNNFGYDWQRNQILPYFNDLREQPAYKDIPDDRALPQDFWNELQSRVDHGVIYGIDTYGIYFEDQAEAAKLYFDAPLDGNAQPSEQYALVKEIGEKLIAKHQDFLASAVEMTDAVCMVKDVSEHAPTSIPGIESVRLNSDWAGGLLGYLLQAGVNPEIIHWGISPVEKLDACRLIITQDNGLLSKDLIAKLASRMKAGATILNFLGNTLAQGMGFGVKQTEASMDQNVALTFGWAYFQPSHLPNVPVFHYDISSDSRCTAALKHGTNIAGYVCQSKDPGAGKFVQMGALYYDVYNADVYATTGDAVARRVPLDSLLKSLELTPRLRFAEGGDRMAIFGRRSPDSRQFWVTVKSAQLSAVSFKVQMSDAKKDKHYRATDLFAGTSVEISGKDLNQTGLPGSLQANGSTVYFVEELQ